MTTTPGPSGGVSDTTSWSAGPILTGSQVALTVVLNWTAPASDPSYASASGYAVYRRPNSGAFVKIGTVAAGVLTYTDTAPVLGTTYQYYVTPLWPSASIAQSNQISLLILPPAMFIVTATNSATSTANYLYSSDGVNWTLGTFPSAAQWAGSAYSPSLGRWVVLRGLANSTVCVTSDDGGVTWTNRTCQSGNWFAVAWSPTLSLFAAVSVDSPGLIQTSPDGVTWTSRTSPATGTLQEIIWSSRLGLFIAGSSTFGSAPVTTSPDGINWTNRTFAGSRTYSAATLADNGTIIAADTQDSLDWTETSANGTSWSLVAATQQTEALGQFGTKFTGYFSTGSLQKIFTSPDAVTWTQVTTPAAMASNFRVLNCRYSPLLGVHVGATNASGATAQPIVYTKDNVTFNLATVPGGLPGGPFWRVGVAL